MVHSITASQSMNCHNTSNAGRSSAKPSNIANGPLRASTYPGSSADHATFPLLLLQQRGLEFGSQNKFIPPSSKNSARPKYHHRQSGGPPHKEMCFPTFGTDSVRRTCHARLSAGSKMTAITAHAAGTTHTRRTPSDRTQPAWLRGQGAGEPQRETPQGPTHPATGRRGRHCPPWRRWHGPTVRAHVATALWPRKTNLTFIYPPRQPPKQQQCQVILAGDSQDAAATLEPTSFRSSHQ